MSGDGAVEQRQDVELEFERFVMQAQMELMLDHRTASLATASWVVSRRSGEMRGQVARMLAGASGTGVVSLLQLVEKADEYKVFKVYAAARWMSS